MAADHEGQPTSQEDESDDLTTSTSDSSEDSEPAAPAADQEWAAALLKIKNRDASIYDGSTQLFPKEPAQVPKKRAVPSTSKGKKKVLRQVLFEQAVDAAGAPEADNDADVPHTRRSKQKEEQVGSLAYDDEQRRLRDALVTTIHGTGTGSEGDDASSGDNDGGGVRLRRRADPAPADAATNGPNIDQTLAEYFGPSARGGGDSRNDGDAFLHNFLAKRMWAEAGDHAGDSQGLYQADAHRESPAADDADEDFLDKAEDYERSYNFRSEEPGGTRIVTYPRNIEGLARKEESKRKKQRERRAERRAAAEKDRAAEVKQLKNAKVKEVQNALNKLASASGKAAPRKDVLKRLMHADFDPAEWDTHMAAVFGDDYYNAMEEEAEVRADDDEMARELASWPEGQEDTSGGAQQAGHGSGHPSANSDGTDASSSSDDGAEGGVASVEGQAGVSRGSDEDDSAQGQETIAAEKQRTKAEVMQLVEEYYSLDHEDEVGGVRTRFRYRSVAPIRDGLDLAEILALPDKDLNAIVGIRKLAPYGENVERIRPNYKALGEARQKLAEQGLYNDKRKKPAAKKHARKAPQAAHGDAQGGKASDRSALTGRGTKRKGRSAAGVTAPAESAPAKKKRPGPALRRALKAAAAAPEGTGVTVVQAASASASPAPGAPPLTPASDKATTPGPTMSKLQMTAEEQKRRRLESYAALSTPHMKHKDEHSQHSASDAAPGKRAGDVETGGGDSGMSKAAKKNAKRAAKRRCASQQHRSGSAAVD